MEYNPITVTDLNKYIKNKIDGDEMLNNVLVKGEISNFKNHYTGHMYFTLKDESSLIKCVMFKSYTTHLSFMPKDGMKVMVLGSVAVFERDGVYQIYAKAMKEDGLGSLYTAYEELKKKLEQEGLFEEAHKKKIPFMPKTIGVLTSNTGAVIRDIINVSTRRNPGVHIRLYPVPVQGPGAAEKIAEGIKFMNENKLADVLIIGRGGGSLEDLWPFNEEIVARAIYDSKVPVISAVGHEIDFTIADFVADLRAPTPTAAAELAVPDMATIKTYLDNVRSRSTISINSYIDMRKQSLGSLINSYVLKKPTAMYEIKEQNLDFLIDRLNKEMKLVLDNTRIRLFKASNSYVLTNPDILYKFKMQGLEHLINKLEVLNPMNTLKRGYAIVKKDDKVVSDIKKISQDDVINIEVKDGIINTKVLEVKYGKE